MIQKQILVNLSLVLVIRESPPIIRGPAIIFI